MIAEEWAKISKIKREKQRYNYLAKQDLQRYDNDLKEICGLKKEDDLEANGLV